MNRFDGLEEFIAVAESGGFAAAARRLGVSTSHVSRQVARLEQRLDVALFARSTRLVRLTEQGENYFEQCAELVAGLQQANESISHERTRLDGTLLISAAGAFAEHHIAPAMADFAAQHPKLKIELNFSTHMVNFVEEGYDFAIRYGRLADSGLIARKLVSREMIAAASPDYLREHGTPERPETLTRHHCLIANSDQWRFLEGESEILVKVNGRWKSNNAVSTVSACKKGLGIAYMPKTSYLDSLTTGACVPILEAFKPKEQSTWIVYQNRKYLPAKARHAIDFLLSRFKDWQE